MINEILEKLKAKTKNNKPSPSPKVSEIDDFSFNLEYKNTTPIKTITKARLTTTEV
jgi:hypothetical protein